MSSNALLAYAGWAFLPNLVTGWLQALYYGITIRAGEPKPQPAYLLFTIYETDLNIRRRGDFYASLGVPHDVDDRGIRSRFRKLAALHHPDKVNARENAASSDGLFVHLKTAQDTLMNPTKRFAYDRFGPDVLEWQHCSSIHDYLVRGAQASVPTYIGTFGFMAILHLAGYLQWGRFWRYLTFVIFAILEYHTLTRPHFSPILTKLLNPLLTSFPASTHPPLLPFQLLILAQKATITISIAFSQLGSLYARSSPTPPPTTTSIDPSQLARLEVIAKQDEQEADRLLGLEMAPYVGDEAGTNDLRQRIKEWLVQNTIRADPVVRDAMGKALVRKRTGAPAGAK
ncbi:hypothetical protein MMC09_004822 [Bachmanniomyces sp. S44760]|nr:hypothetical protein [Bachmanniomyces sp. S44760]